MNTRCTPPMGTHNVQNLIAAATLAFALNPGAAAQEKSLDRHEQLTYDGVVYEYKSIPKWDSDGKLMYYIGQMSGRRRAGELEFFQKTDQSAGCDMDFPAISLIDVPHKKIAHKKTYVLFCGTYDGRQNSLRFYSPDLGIVSSFNFGNHTPIISKDNNIVELTHFREIWPKSISPKVVYPTIYNVVSDGYSVEIIKKDSREISTQAKYKKLLVDVDSPTVRNWNIARNLITLSFIDDKESYCSLAKLVSNIDIFSEIEAEIDFPLIKCKEL